MRGIRPTPVAGPGEKVRKEDMVFVVVDYQGVVYICLYDDLLVLAAFGEEGGGAAPACKNPGNIMLPPAARPGHRGDSKRG